MNIFLWLSTLVTLGLSVNCYLENVSEYIKHLKSYQIIIFVDKSSKKNYKHEDDTIRKLTRQFSTVTIDLGSMVTENRSLSMPVFKNPRSSAIYVILEKEYTHTFDVYKVYQIIDKLVTISPVQMRPKCLLIFPNSTNYLPDNEVKKILKYTWVNKFIDFTVLKIDGADSSVVANYNPFTEIYSSKNLLDTDEIFPDKLENVNKYPLKLPAYTLKPHIIIDTEEDKILDIRGIIYPYVKIILEKVNFSPRFILENDTKSDSKNIENILSKLENNSLIISLNTFLVGTNLFGRNVIVGTMVDEGNMVAVVPIIRKPKFYFSLTILLYLLSFPAIILLFLGFSKLLKFDTEKWNLLFIYQIFIAIPVDLSPKRLISESIIYIFIATLSIIYSNIFFATLNDMKVVYDEVKFSTFQDLVDSKMKVHTPFFANSHDTEEVKKLLSNATIIDSYEDCIKKLIKTRSIICILSVIRGNYYESINLDDQGMPVMKLAGASFHHQYAAFAYEKGSVFAEKFDKLTRLIIESGLLKDQVIRKYLQIHSSEFSDSENAGNILTEQLIVLSVFGYTIAIIVFLWELISYYVFSFSITFNEKKK